MSWISPTFEDNDFSLPPPKKKPKATNESVIGTQIVTESKLDSCNWLQKYKPKAINELAVDIGNVKELKNWLIRSKQCHTNKLLLLTGPSGCGKTATFETVCKTLGFKVLEWITPVDKFEAHTSALFDIEKSHSKQFEEYLLKSSRYDSCLGFKLLHTVILVKDFPNIFLLKPSTFHDILENISNKCVKNPIVFICSENSLRRKLFSNKMKCQVSMIRFNPITNLQMLKVLKAIILQEKKGNKDIQILCDKALTMISSSNKGDVRGAVSELYFRCVKPSVQRNPSQSQTPDKSKDSQIDFFHGLEKVLSPKKIKAKEVYKFSSTPEAIVEHFLGESKDFVNRLNENFYTKFTNISDLSNAAQRLATSDILLARWQEDIFNEYALSVAVRGVMVSNTNPQEPTFQCYGKQETCHLEKNASYLQLEGKRLFSDICSLNYQYLFDILPYAKCLLGNLNPCQENYLSKTFDS